MNVALSGSLKRFPCVHFLGGASGKEPICRCTRVKVAKFHHRVGKIPWRRADHSSSLAWRIPRTEKPGGLQSIGSQRVRIAEQLSMHTCKIYTSPLCDDCGHAKTLRNEFCDFQRLFLALRCSRGEQLSSRTILFNFPRDDIS